MPMHIYKMIGPKYQIVFLVIQQAYKFLLILFLQFILVSVTKILVWTLFWKKISVKYMSKPGSKDTWKPTINSQSHSSLELKRLEKHKPKSTFRLWNHTGTLPNFLSWSHINNQKGTIPKENFLGEHFVPGSQQTKTCIN